MRCVRSTDLQICPRLLTYEQDDVHGRSTHDLDVSEGAALRMHDEIEESVDWYEPDRTFNNSSFVTGVDLWTNVLPS